MLVQRQSEISHIICGPGPRASKCGGRTLGRDPYGKPGSICEAIGSPLWCCRAFLSSYWDQSLAFPTGLLILSSAGRACRVSIRVKSAAEYSRVLYKGLCIYKARLCLKWRKTKRAFSYFCSIFAIPNLFSWDWRLERDSCSLPYCLQKGFPSAFLHIWEPTLLFKVFQGRGL